MSGGGRWAQQVQRPQEGGRLNTVRVWGLVPAEAGASQCGPDQQVSGL